MELRPVLDRLTEDLRRAGALGGPETERIAELLVATSEASIRLRILEVLSNAARELESSAPGVSVDVRLDEGDPVLTLSGASGDDHVLLGDDESLGTYAEDQLVRLTIRLPEGLKTRVEQVASATGASINSWIVTALARSLEMPTGQRSQPGRRIPRRMTGFIQT